MAIIIHQWFSLLFMFSTGTSTPVTTPIPGSAHPFYVSVTEINHNSGEKTLEIACKMFLDDTEKTLNKLYRQPVELTKPVNPKQAQQQLFDYTKVHLKINVDGKNVPLEFVGYEIEGASIWSYYQVSNIASLKKLTVTNTIFFETYPTQINIIHSKVGADKKSTRLTNPDAVAVFEF